MLSEKRSSSYAGNSTALSSGERYVLSLSAYAMMYERSSKSLWKNMEFNDKFGAKCLKSVHRRGLQKAHGCVYG